MCKPKIPHVFLDKTGVDPAGKRVYFNCFLCILAIGQLAATFTGYQANSLRDLFYPRIPTLTFFGVQ